MLGCGAEKREHAVAARTFAPEPAATEDRSRRESVGTGRISAEGGGSAAQGGADRSEEHTSELQSLMRISYAVFCLKTKKTTTYCKTVVNINTKTHSREE